MVSSYAYVNPVVAITLGVLFRGEHLSWRLLVGAVVVVVAVAAVVRKEPADAAPLEADVVGADRDAGELASRRVA
jgi:drug/metabolite transporter (DMT)-like permease